MKRFWKIIFWIAGILAALGLIVGIVGAALGGLEQLEALPEYHFNERTEGHHIILSNPEVAAVDSKSENMELAAADAVTDLVMEIGGSSVSIEETEGSFYGICISGGNHAGYELKDGVLTIQTLGNKPWKGRRGTKSSITLYIPKDNVINSIEMEIGSGTLRAEKLHANESIRVEAGAGQFILDGITTERFKIELGAGSAELLHADINDMDIDVGAGEMTYQGTVRGNVEADCGMGSLTMRLEGKKEAFHYEAESVMGSIRVNGSELIEESGGHHLEDHTSQNMELACVMGNIEIIFEDRKG